MPLDRRIRSLILCLLSAGCIEGEDLAREAWQGQDVAQEAWSSVLVPCNDTIGCRTNPSDVEATCEAAYGASSGKPYRLVCDCAPASHCTNSDCFSNCFRNDCRCGRPDGRNAGCAGVAPIPADPEWHSCTCHRSDSGIHNYWCCQAVPDGHTTDGWDCTDYCGDGNDVTAPPCTSTPPPPVDAGTTPEEAEADAEPPADGAPAPEPAPPPAPTPDAAPAATPDAAPAAAPDAAPAAVPDGGAPTRDAGPM